MEKKSKRTPITIITIIVLICALISTYFFLFDDDDKTVNIASTHDVIEYFNTTGLTDYYNKKLGININWIEYDDGQDAYLQIKGEYGKDSASMPDAYLGFNISDAQLQIIGPSMFLDMTSYIASDTERFRVIMSSEEFASQIRSGNSVYSFPSLYDDYSGRYPQKVWVNKEWLEAVGADMPATPEQFYELLVKFKNDDPNGNGQADEIALGCAYKGIAYSGFGFIINAYCQTSYDLSDRGSILSLDRDGTVYSEVTSEGFKTALKYINRLVAEGLVSADVFENDRAYLAEVGYGEKYGVIVCSDIYTLFGKDMERASAYIPMPPLNGHVAATAVKNPQINIGGFMIASESKHIAALMKMGDMMLSQEGTLTLLYGEKGIGWNDADEAGAMGGSTAVWVTNRKENLAGNALVKSKVPMWYSSDIILGQQANTDKDGVADLQTEANWQGYLNKVTRDVYEPIGAETSRYILPEHVVSGSQEDAIRSYINSTCRDFVLGNSSIDENWDSYVNALDEKGIGGVIGMMQNTYNSR